MSESGTSEAPPQVEERLRAALAARAHSVRPADLRPLRPPTAADRPHRLVLRRVAVGLLALAAVAALAFFTVRGEAPHPAEPARSPSPTKQTPSPVPSPVRPTPEPTAGGPAG